MEEYILNDAFYCFRPTAFTRHSVGARYFSTGKGREELASLGVIFVPDLNSFPNNDFDEWDEKHKYRIYNVHASLSSMRCFCPHYQARATPLISENFELFTFNLEGTVLERGILSSKHPYNALIMSEESSEELARFHFTGTKDVALKELDNLGKVYFEDEKNLEAFKKYHFIALQGGGFIDFSHEIEKLLKIPPYRCSRCGGSLGICPSCMASLWDCPHCGKAAAALDVAGISSKNRSSRSAYLDITFVIKKETRLLEFETDGECFFSKPKHSPLRGENWNGNDYCRLWDSYSICSGRMAKWFVENQFGNFALTPYPVDVTNCTPDQRERIEAVRYSPYRR